MEPLSEGEREAMFELMVGGPSAAVDSSLSWGVVGVWPLVGVFLALAGLGMILSPIRRRRKVAEVRPTVRPSRGVPVVG